MTARTLSILALAGLLAASGTAFAQQPKPQPQKPAAPAAGKPAEPTKPAANLEGDWQGGPVNGEDGRFAYCVSQAKFDTGHTLVFARTQKGEVNVALGIPGATLPQGDRWNVTVSVDDKAKREKVAVASKVDLLVIPLGNDEEIFGLLGTGKQFVMQSTTDRIAFVLKGTKKAMGDLKSCAEKAGAGMTPLPTAPRMPFPEALVVILNAAGVKDPVPVTFENIPPEQRPADFAWKHGQLFGGVRERQVEEGKTIEALTEEYVADVKKRCTGTATNWFDTPEKLPLVTLRNGTVDCTMQDGGGVHLALLFYLTDTRLFTVFFHEAPAGVENGKLIADVTNNALTGVIRDIGNRPRPAPQPAPGAAAPPAAGAASSTPSLMAPSAPKP